MSDERLIDGGRGSGRGADIGDRRGAPPGSNRGGGPKTPWGLATVERNLRQPGGSNARHGIYPFKERGIAPVCRSCQWRLECELDDPERYDASGHCWRLAEFQQELAAEIRRLEHIKQEDGILVDLLCQDVALKELIDAYVAGSEPNPPAGLAKERGACANRIIKLCDQLGMSPRSRATLKLTEGGGIMAQLMAVHEELDSDRAAAAEETVEGQFELFEEGGESSEPRAPSPELEQGQGEGDGNDQGRETGADTEVRDEG